MDGPVVGVPVASLGEHSENLASLLKKLSVCRDGDLPARDRHFDDRVIDLDEPTAPTVRVVDDEPVARAHGVIVTDAQGQSLRAPLDVDSDIAWIGYANAALRDAVEPALRGGLIRHGLLPAT